MLQHASVKPGPQEVLTPQGAQAIKVSLDQVITNASRIILGKERPLRLALTCLMARGHLLLEDLPGMGKTTLAHVLGNTLGLNFHRIQFTSDLLPADILGTTVFEREKSEFCFHHGPIFSQLVLADEVNRATPKTQSALLEAMEEFQVTVDGMSYALPQPFFVIATQNPLHQIGTFPLPESQLDRFLLRLSMGYPDQAAERALLQGRDRRDMLSELKPSMTVERLIAIQRAVPQVHASEALLDYVQAIIAHSRQSAFCQNGLSPRAGLGLLHAAQAWALMAGRNHVLPEDVQTVLPSVVMHRLQPAAEYTGHNADEIVARLLAVPIP